MKKNICTFLLSFLLCNISSAQLNYIKINSNHYSFKTKKVIKNWHLKDIEKDSIIGISLQRAYDSLLHGKKQVEVIVAILDNEIEINHDKLKNRIWYNKNEIPNNNIDDDSNGFIDDINGWNFKGNSKGENSLFVNFEYVRILRALNEKYKHLDSIAIKKDLEYPLYVRAKKAFDTRFKYEQKKKEGHTRIKKRYFSAINKVNSLFNNKRIITTKLLDSLNDKNIMSNKEISFLKECVEYNIDSNYIAKQQYMAKERREKLLNLNYNDRIIPNDDENNLNDSIYGNKIVDSNLNLLKHGIRMAGVINSVFREDKIKIMTTVTSSYGDEHDKDIALAIRYAVNNGAKVINMSFSKEFSKNFNWVKDAIQYAEQKDVLIISAAGNFGNNLNLKENKTYPNDNFNGEDECSDNFLLVGSTNAKLDKNFRRKSSNYGNSQVDLFAPGQKIATLGINNNNNKSTNATSAASAITSGVASLIRSYYPSLTASQVKHILMDSGLEFTFEVSTPTEEDKNKTTPFNKLSKSGKYLNAYNALLMAGRISKD